MLTKLIKQDLQEPRVVVVPTGPLLHQGDENIFEEYRSQLASVTPSNWGMVCKNFWGLGIDGQDCILAQET